jgi:hypothetical protein
MSGIKAKISETVNKLTHKSGTDANTTGTSGYDNTGTTGTGMGHHSHGTHGTTGGLETGSTGYNQTSTGMGGTTGSEYGTTGSEYGTTGTTGTGMGTTGSEYETTGTGMGTTGGMTSGTGQVIDSETFTKTEDHEVLIEKKRYELEHRPVQKQYVVETKFVGEQAVQGAPTEVVGNESKIVDEHIKQAPAGDRTVVVENVDVPASEMRSTMGTTTGTGMGSGTTGTGMGSGTTGTGMGGMGGQQTY